MKDLVGVAEVVRRMPMQGDRRWGTDWTANAERKEIMYLATVLVGENANESEGV